MRTPDRRRPDMEEILERYGIEFYDQFEMLLINEANRFDDWKVHRNLDTKPIFNDRY